MSVSAVPNTLLFWSLNDTVNIDVVGCTVADNVTVVLTAGQNRTDIDAGYDKDVINHLKEINHTVKSRVLY